MFKTGIECKTKIIDINNKKVKLNIYDTMGQEKFRSISQSFYKGAQGIIFCYDVTSEESLLNIKLWVRQIEKSIDSNKIIKYIIGNKCDLPKNVDSEKAAMFAKQYNMKFFEASAMNDFNIKEMFQSIARDIIDTDQPNLQSFKIDSTLINKNEKKCCK
jgi:small GTP-binding protein